MKRLASIIILLVLCAVARGQVKFDGQNDHISGLIMPATNTFTVCFTMARSVGNLRPKYYADNILKFGTGNIGRMSISYVSNPSLYRVWPNILSQDSLNIPVVLGEYHRCAAVIASNGVDAYVDGVLSGHIPVDKVTWSLNTITRIASTWTGVDDAATGNYFFDGVLEDFCIYTRALSASEIYEDCLIPWTLANDSALVLQMCVVTNDTGTPLTGIAPNYGTGADGTYSNTLTVAQPHVQTEKPLTMELP